MIGVSIVMSEKLLSVIVPVYNVEPYISRCLSSIIRQSYKELEIICVNDGSTDNSEDLIKEYQKKDSRIVLINKENAGLVSARKAGLQKSIGKYVTYVDSDDYIDQGMYKYMMDAIVKNDVDIVTSGVYRDYGERIVEERDSILQGCYSDKKLSGLRNELIETSRFFKRNISSHLWNKIFLKEKIIKHQMRVPNEITIGEDAAVFYPMMFDINSIYVTNKVFYHYCIRKDSIMGSQLYGEKDPAYLMLNYLKSQLLENSMIQGIFTKQYKVLSLYTRLLRDPFNVMRYENNILYPFGKVLKEEKIVLFGAGKFGVAMKYFLDEEGFTNVAWVDTNVHIEGVSSFDDVKKDFDKVLIGTLIYDTQQDILKKIKNEGINEEQVLTLNFCVNEL